MSATDIAIYAGHVVHKRLRPKRHALDYRVFSMLVDVDQIDRAAGRLRFFSRNRWNIFGLYDRDYGPGDGTAVGEIARACLRGAGRPHEGRRILLLSYPRIFGYAFNPLSVFYVYASDDTLESVIYEVNNTFGERTSYVVAAGDAAPSDVYAQACAKSMYVSPFTPGRGDYSFRITRPGDEALVAVLLRDSDGALLKTHFKGRRLTVSDRAILALVARYPLFTIKVISAIHIEALKLWLKGIPLTERHRSPRYSSTVATTIKQG
jgi:uncharacterized protein